ncbi:MAG: hypothetical protein M1153_01130 [Patescibacteria group bacterium]|nr:hypothetical protein [Patescibacteria group bacterium]
MLVLRCKKDGLNYLKNHWKPAAASAIVGLVLVGIARVFPAAAADATATSTSSLQEQINANDQQIATLNQQIAVYQAELQKIGTDKRTLQQALNALELQKRKLQAQVYLTQHQINTTQLQIQQIGGAIVTTQGTIAANKAALAEEMRTLQQYDNQTILEQLLSAGGLSQAVNDINTALELQSGIQNDIQSLGEQENTLTASQTASKQKQDVLTAQKQSLTAQQTSLLATERSKTQLLAETNAKQSVYEKLLAQAQAELASYSTFTQNAGGSKLLGNQTVCDSWGCYYNQRDAAWGADPLNETKFTLASDGCLVTSMAMVMTHYGYRNVTPVTINSNPSNFAAYYPAYLLFTVNVDGVSATRKASYIDSTLATGNPVIVGLHAYGGTHYVVLTSGRAGNYVMKDPYVPDGNDISFNSHYSMREIFGVDKVVISG